MALSRVKTWITGEILYAADLNAEYNNILNNALSLISPLTASLDVNSKNLTSVGNLTFASGYDLTMTAGSIWQAKGANIASGATVTVGSDGNTFHITGTTTITAITPQQAGHWFVFIFDGALTLTHNATTLRLPGAANITTAANDYALFVADTAANVHCMCYTKADGSTLAAASTTEVLTGTDTAKTVTCDALAALWEEGSDVASAGTISLGEGGFFDITGTTTITDIDFATTKAGRWAWCRFTGALTLTHNATTLILPTSANIVTAADDTALFVSEGGDNVRCYVYFRKTGASLSSASGTVTAGTTLTKNPVAVNTVTTQAHGLAQVPDFYRAYMECITAEQGYSIGDRIHLSAMDGGGGNSCASWVGDTTNVVLLLPNNLPLIYNKTTPVGGVAPTAANWKILITPYKIN